MPGCLTRLTNDFLAATEMKAHLSPASGNKLFQRGHVIQNLLPYQHRWIRQKKEVACQIPDSGNLRV